MWRFWTVALAVTAVWTVTLVTEGERSAAPRIGWWALSTAALLFAWRWPYLVGPALLNPDESQMIAGAITLKSCPLFWESVDGTTHGPLADLPLLVANLLGFPLNFGTARAVAGALVLGGFILAGRGLMLVYPPTAVRLGLAPAMLLWASIAYYDFSGYTSEQSAIFLLLATTWPLLAAFVPRGRPLRERVLRLAVAGALLGSVPYAKLQGAPLAGAVVAVLLGVLWAERSRDLRSRVLASAAAIAGAVAPSAVVLVYLLHWRLFSTFWAAYVMNNLQYAEAGALSWGAMLRRLWDYADAAPGLHAASFAVLGLTGGAVLASLSRRWRAGPATTRPVGWRPAAVALALLVGGIYTTLAPHRTFGHYLQFLGIPLGLTGAIAAGEQWAAMSGSSRLTRRLAMLACAGVATIPIVLARAGRTDPDMFGQWTARGGEMRYPASIEIARLAHPGDSMSVWGWMPFFYAETGLPQATREAHTQRQIQGAMVPYYRSRYMQDLRRHPPRIFVDAVGGRNFSYDATTPQLRHECFPELAAYIAQHYRLHGEVAGSRIYLRSDEVTDRQTSPSPAQTPSS